MATFVEARSLPTPRLLPFGGNLFDFARDPVSFMVRLAAQTPAEDSPVQHFILGTQHSYLIRDVDMIHEVLVSQGAKFKKGQLLEEAKVLLGDGLLTSETDVHRRHRRLMQPSFTPRHIAAYADTMVRLAESATAGWQHGQTISTTHEMIQLTLSIITQTMFGFDSSTDMARVENDINLVIESVAPSLKVFLPRFLQGEAKVTAAIDRLNETIYRIISMRRNGSVIDDHNLLSLLMAARDEGDGTGLTDQELRDEVMTIYMAGHETTANLLAWTFLALAENPHVERQFHEELDEKLGNRAPAYEDLPHLKYTQSLVKESLRCYPPAWTVGRTPVDEVTIGGYRFYPGDTLFLTQYVIHHDARYFANAEQFDPARWTPNFEQSLPAYAYFPFGGGPRICIGNHFALMEAQLLLAAIGRKFKLTRVNKRPVRRLAGITMRPKGDLRMRVIERHVHTEVESMLGSSN